jgi:hypothetical protein
MSVKWKLREDAADDRVAKQPPPLPAAAPPPLPAAAPPLPHVVDAIPEDSAVGLGGVLDRCPRCRGQLISPNSLGWCQKCGYCRTLEEDKARVVIERPAAHRGGAPSRLEMVYWLTRVPGWAWILVCGVVSILLVVFPVSHRLPDDCLERAVWCLVQLGAGLILFWGTQFWTLLMVADRDEKLGAKDVFLSGHLWSVAARALPLTRWQFCLAAWAVTLIITAFWPIGGLDYMFRYLPRSRALPV